MNQDSPTSDPGPSDHGRFRPSQSQDKSPGGEPPRDGTQPAQYRVGQGGQSTVEYALVLMGAAALAMLLISWATGTDVIGRLFETVFGGIIDGAQ